MQSPLWWRGILVAAQQTPTLAAASGDGGILPIDSVSKPVPTPSTTPSKPPGTPPATPSGSVKQTIDLTKLKPGAAPATSYVDGRTVHVGDSAFALGGPVYRDGYGDGLFAALDLKTGKAVREWSGGSAVAIISTAMEDADHILVLAEQGGKTAIARCAPKTGTCELAAPLKKGTGDSNNRPYQLGH